MAGRPGSAGARGRHRGFERPYSRTRTRSCALYHQGYADQVWISQPSSPAEVLKTMKIFYLGEDFYNEKILLAQQVPADAIRILERPSANTQEEVLEIREILPPQRFAQRDCDYVESSHPPRSHDMEKTCGF